MQWIYAWNLFILIKGTHIKKIYVLYVLLHIIKQSKFDFLSFNHA